MKAEDLMVGDWVQIVPDAPVMPNEYHRIDWIRTGEIGLDNRKIVTYPYIQPIPLTPEILERNGFRSYGDSWYIPCDDENVRIGFHMYVTVLDIKTDNVSLYKKLPYGYRSTVKDETLSVHELQHALRLCEIDQEIVL